MNTMPCVICEGLAHLFDCDTKTAYGRLYCGFRCEECGEEFYELWVAEEEGEGRVR